MLNAAGSGRRRARIVPRSRSESAEEKMHWLARWANSFRHAGRGLWLAGRGRNLRIMLLGALAVVALGIVYDVSRLGWAVLLLCMCGVLGAEAMNTAVERLADHIERRYDAEIHDIKALAAGAVLVISAPAPTAG